jgi:hypothetical protein
VSIIEKAGFPDGTRLFVTYWSLRFLFTPVSEQPGKAVLRPEVKPKFAKVELPIVWAGE